MTGKMVNTPGPEGPGFSRSAVRHPEILMFVTS